MKYFSFFALVLVFQLIHTQVQGQSDSALKARADSIRMTDSLKKVQKVRDSILQRAQQEIVRAADSIKKVITARRKERMANVQVALAQNPYFNIRGEPVRQFISIRKQENNDGIFYFITGLVLFLALMRVFFYKYVSTMFTLFFRATLRQQQLREQLLQAPLPALLMNIFFVISVATYITFLAHHNQLAITGSFWTTLLYAIILVAGVYVVKFLFLNIVGWIFGISNVADTYIFIVFLINKMIGIFLLPFIALFAFPSPMLLPVVLTMSYILVGGMLFYRFIISYRPVRSEIKLNRLHFFLYLCAFEIAPLLLIYKVLLVYGGTSL